jgi:23S rRNA pseudouridine1911/1915/1917 synthase
MSGALEIKVIHEPSAAEPFVVLSKPAGLASAPLKSLDEDSAFSQCARLFPAAKSVCGKKAVEGGLLHRIDTATSGLLLVASIQEFYDHIIAAQDAGRFVKGYRAECDVNANNAQALGGFPPLGMQAQKAAVLCGLEISSYFRPFGKGGKEVRPVLQDSNVAALKKIGSKKIYSTKIVAADFLGEGAAKLECKIAQGYRHQVRCHLAWLGFPVRGDALYNAVGGPSGGPMRFEAVSLEFPDLFSEKIFRFTLD